MVAYRANLCAWGSFFLSASTWACNQSMQETELDYRRAATSKNPQLESHSDHAPTPRDELRDRTIREETVDGMVRLSETAVASLQDGLQAGDDARLSSVKVNVAGYTEELEEGDWVPVDDASLTLVLTPATPDVSVGLAREISVEPESNVHIENGEAMVSAVTGTAEKMTIVTAADDGRVEEQVVECPGECILDIGAIEAELGAEIVVMATDDPASAAVTDEEPESVDEVIAAAAEDRSSLLEPLRGERRAVRARILELRSELDQTRQALRHESAQIKPALNALREKRKQLLEARRDLSRAMTPSHTAPAHSAKQAALEHANPRGKGHGVQAVTASTTLKEQRERLKTEIDQVQTEIRVLKAKLVELRAAWAALKPQRVELASLRGELRRLKRAMLEIVQAREIYCGAFAYAECSAGADAQDVQVLSVTSARRCEKGISFGLKEKGVIWVDRGCRGRFLVRGP